MVATEKLDVSTEIISSRRNMPTWRDGMICIMPVAPWVWSNSNSEGDGNDGPSAGDIDNPDFGSNDSGNDGPSAGDIDGPGFVSQNSDVVGLPVSNGGNPSFGDEYDTDGPSATDVLNPGFGVGAQEYQNFIDHEKRLSDGVTEVEALGDSDEPTEADIIGANEYQNFIDHERDLRNGQGEADLIIGNGSNNTSKFRNILDEIYNNRYNDFIDKEKGLNDKYTEKNVAVLTSGTSKSEKLVADSEATIFEFKINKGKGGGADKIYKSTNKDAIVFSIDNEKSARKLTNKLSTLTKSGNNLIVSYNSYKSGKKTVNDKLTLVNYFKRSAAKSLKDIAIIDKKGNILDTLNLQEQILKFSGKSKTSDTVFDDKIKGSKKKDIYTFKNGGNDIATDKKGNDSYKVYLNKVENLVINDKSGKDTLILKDAKKSDVIFGFDVVRKETSGKTVYTFGKDLYLMSNNDKAGMVQVNNFFKSFKDKNKDGIVDGFKYSSGRIEKFKYADGSGFKFNVNNINEIKSNVVAWLDTHSDYNSANDVFTNGTKDDIQSLIAAYSGYNQV